MANDVEISVRVDNRTATGLAAVNTSLQSLKTAAGQAGTKLESLAAKAGAATIALQALSVAADGAGDSLRDLRRRAEAAGSSMRELRDGTAGINGSLRTFNTRSQTTNTRLGDLSDRTRALRTDTDDLDGSMNRLTGTMGGLRGSLGTVRTSSGNAHGGMQRLKMAALTLAPALVPIGAAALAMGGQFVAGLGAAGVAVGVFGLAIGRQVASMSKATAAEKAYNDAVKEHGGAGSKAAAEAARKLQLALADMPKATQEAAAGLILFKESYKSWSDSTADSTMPVVTKSFATFGALLPRLTPLVRGTSTELDRMMTVLAGGIQSESFERFMASFAEFASGALAKTTTGLVKFSQALNTGAVGRELSEFMAYASEVGPAVGETLGNLAKAMVHVVVASGDLGVSILTAVNALAELVNAIPSGALSTFIQVYAALKLVSLGMGLVGAAASSGALARLGAYFAVMRAAGVATTLSATAASMTAMTKATIGLGVLAVAAIGIGKLAESARGAPPDVDKLTTSLKNLATTGKFTGEFKSTFGDIDGLVEKVKEFGKATKEQEEYVQSFGSAGIGPLDDLRRKFHSLFDDLKDGTQSFSALEADFDSLDQSMADLVSGGRTDEAAKNFNTFEQALKGAGKSTKEINALFPEYRAAMSNLAAENRLAAEGMGLFGQQALDVQVKLAAQKASADGLAQSINALNNVYLMARGGIRGMEAAIDAADAAFKKNGATLDETTEKGRGNNQALDDIAAATMKAAESARANGASWEAVNSIYDSGRKKIAGLTEGIKGNEAAAKKLADQILKTPNKTARINMQKEDAERDLGAFVSAVKKSPNSKSVTLRTLSKTAEQLLAQFGLKVKRLPDGSVKVTAKTGDALGDLAAVRRARDALRDKNFTITTTKLTVFKSVQASGMSNQAAKNAAETSANGNIFRSFANGSERHVAEIAQPNFRLWAEPETGGEAYIPLSEAKRGRSLAILEEVADRFGYGLEKFAKGGLTKAQKAQKARTAAEKAARSGAQGDLTISHFGKMAGYQRSEFGSALAKPDGIGSLVNALNQWRGVIMKATSGRTEKNLLRQLDSTGRALLKQERALGKVTAELDKAKSKLSDLKSAASQLASSVKSNILGSANITKGAGGEGRVTTASIMGGLTSSRDKATAFAQALKDLQKKGLSKDLLAQVAEAGIDGGGLETATAILGASGSEIKSMNQLQAQITKAATSAGKTTADAVYKAQIKAQEKVVNGLKSVQEKLTKSMDKLTKAMEKAIEKAFSKKASGGIVGAAASGGVRGGLTLTGEEGPEIVRLPVGSRVYPTGQSKRMAWESMLTEPKRPAAHPQRGTAGGSVQPVVVHQTITLDGKVIARQIFDPMRDEVLRRTGGDVQKALGRN